MFSRKIVFKQLIQFFARSTVNAFSNTQNWDGCDQQILRIGHCITIEIEL